MSNSTTRNPLLQAIKSKDTKNFRLILRNEGWPKDSPWSDYELLVTALRQNRKIIARAILDEGARTWKPNCLDDSPLHIAVLDRYTSSSMMIDKLITCGARVDVKNRAGDAPLHLAFGSWVPDKMIDLMLARHVGTEKVDVVNGDGLTFLHIACTRSNLDVVKGLVDAQVNAQVSLDCGKDYAGYTALHFAVDNGRYEIVEYLIEQGADIYKQDSNGTTPLHLGLKLRDVQMIDLLFAHDKDKKNIVNKFGLSHFMVACAGSKRSVVEAHLENSLACVPLNDVISAKVDKIENCTGYTPLHFAVDLGQSDIVEYLLGEGADCCAAAENGLTPHLLAAKREHKRVDKKLRKHCRIVSRCTKMRSEEQDVDVWGDDYSKRVLIESVQEIKRLRSTLNEFKKMSAALEG